MTGKEAFRLGFVQRCAEEGYTLPDIEAAAQHLVDLADNRIKVAGIPGLDLVAKTFGKGLDYAGHLTGTATRLGAAGAIAAPLAIGAGLGYGAAQLTDNDPSDTEDYKTQELIDAYRQAAKTVRMRQAVTQRLMDRRQPSRAFRAY